VKIFFEVLGTVFISFGCMAMLSTMCYRVFKCPEERCFQVFITGMLVAALCLAIFFAFSFVVGLKCLIDKGVIPL